MTLKSGCVRFDFRFAGSEQCSQAQDVLAASVPEEAEAFTGALAGLSDADVVELAETELVQSETPTANFTRDLAENVVLCVAVLRDCEDADAVLVRRADQTNRSHGLLPHTATVTDLAEAMYASYHASDAFHEDARTGE